MEDPKRKDGMMFLFGTLVGALVVAVGSPYRGSEVRQKLKDTAHRVKSKGNDISEDLSV